MAKLDEFLLCACIIVSFLTLSTATDTIAANQTIKDGESIVSAGNDFELGFFSLNNSSNRYLGIWSNKIDTRTVVWVPNKETPLSNTSGELKLDTDGRLLLLRDGDTVWSSAFPYRSSVNPVAQLLDTGNFVVRDLFSPDVDNIIWQSNTFCNGCGSCGLNSACVDNSLACSCLTGFEPRQPERWNLGDWSGGCLRHRSSDCVRGGYHKTSDCSCAAYASPDNGSGCSLWFGDLKNTIRVNPGGQELYIKMTTLKGAKSESSRNKVFKVVVSIAVSLTVVALILALYAWSKKRRSFYWVNPNRPNPATQVNTHYDPVNESQPHRKSTEAVIKKRLYDSYAVTVISLNRHNVLLVPFRNI